MERWLKEELDKMTCGEVALRVFGSERELSAVQKYLAERLHIA